MRSRRRECSGGSNDSMTRAMAKCKKTGTCPSDNAAKHKEFMLSTEDNIGDMMVSKLPGVRPVDCRQLCEHGYKTVQSLLEKFMDFNMDRFCFINWLVSVMYMRRSEAHQCCCALLQWHHQNTASESSDDEEEEEEEANARTAQWLQHTQHWLEHNTTDECEVARARLDNRRRRDLKTAERAGRKYIHTTPNLTPAAESSCKQLCGQGQGRSSRSRSTEGVIYSSSREDVRITKNRKKSKATGKAPVQLSAADAVTMIRQTVSLVPIPYRQRKNNKTK